MNNIPVYFPMTYLDPVVETRLAACFAQTAVYRPSNSPLPESMRAAVAQDRLVVRTPMVADSAKILGQMEAYYAWAEVNKGADFSFFKGNRSGVPFFGDTSVSRIRQNIKEMGGEGVQPEPADPVFAARLFLEMAQARDCQNSELDRSLADVKAKENSMLADLLGDEKGCQAFSSAKPPAAITDPGAHMTAYRIQAWWKMTRAESGNCNFLATDSRAVLAYLLESGPELETVGSLMPVPLEDNGGWDRTAWQKSFSDYLHLLASGADTQATPPPQPMVKSGESHVNISLYRYNNGSASAFFQSLEKPATSRSDCPSKMNLVICLIEDAGV